MKKINYKSDFDFILRLKDCADKDKTVPFPESDFDARFWTSSKANAYTASCIDGVYTNCFRTEDGDTIGSTEKAVTEYAEYNAYVEQCKIEAVKKLTAKSPQ